MTLMRTLIGLFCLTLWSLLASAEVENFVLEEGETLPRSSLSKQVHQEINDVLSSEDFARKKTVTRWRKKDLDDEETREETFPEWLIDIIESMEGTGDFFKGLALVLKVLLYGLVIWLAVFLVLRYREQLARLFSSNGGGELEGPLPATMFGLDVKKTSLPKDIVATARNHWSEGDQRSAIAVLLRASLVKLLHEHNCRFFDSDTENECCERIEQQTPSAVSAYMWMLVRAWQQIAYAHRPLSTDEFDQLCSQWQETF